MKRGIRPSEEEAGALKSSNERPRPQVYLRRGHSQMLHNLHLEILEGKADLGNGKSRHMKKKPPSHSKQIRSVGAGESISQSGETWLTPRIPHPRKYPGLGLAQWETTPRTSRQTHEYGSNSGGRSGTRIQTFLH